MLLLLCRHIGLLFGKGLDKNLLRHRIRKYSDSPVHTSSESGLKKEKTDACMLHNVYIIKAFQNFRFPGECRNLRFTADPIHSYRLKNHVIRTLDTITEDICQLKCYLEPNCVSYNFKKKAEANGQHKCDLNNATHEHSNNQAKNENYVYRGAEVNIASASKKRGLIKSREVLYKLLKGTAPPEAPIPYPSVCHFEK